MLPTVDPSLIEAMDTGAMAKQPSWTWTHGYDEPLLSAGFMPITPGVGESWAVANPILSQMRARVELVYDIYDLHLEYCVRHDIRRVQCLVDNAFPAGKVFVDHLGYRYEAALKEWGRDGQIKLRYAWLLKDHV